MGRRLEKAAGGSEKARADQKGGPEKAPRGPEKGTG